MRLYLENGRLNEEGRRVSTEFSTLIYQFIREKGKLYDMRLGKLTKE